MSFSSEISKSVNAPRLLFELDNSSENTQWVNLGAGVWYLNVLGLYPEVDISLLTGFTAQAIPGVNKVIVDMVPLLIATSLLNCTTDSNTFFWDYPNLYIHLDGDSPYLHSIILGVIYGYSDTGFTPVGTGVYYEARLNKFPSISKSKNTLFYGKVQYEQGGVELTNSDGDLDLFGESVNVYGKQCSIYLGFDGLDIADYRKLYVGYSESLSINETSLQIQIRDNTKSFTKNVIYSCTDKNALVAIEEILYNNFGIPYTASYYNTVQWELAKLSAYNITIDITAPTKAIDIIQDICVSTFGLFQIDGDGMYSFRITRSTDLSLYTIPQTDILNPMSIKYDPAELITSAKIGYAKDWTTTASVYTYLTDTSQEAAIYEKYKIYNEKEFDTYLITLLDAQDYSTNILTTYGIVRPTVELEVPMKYIDIDIGMYCNIELNRENLSWFGYKKCEIVGKSYDFNSMIIKLSAKITV